ncbi:MAG: chromosomal replication initiator protein DnaA [Bacteroidaceae bacterium]|nr:chromosomal replication initiator protein DnaA [Bacteroidaceae bacterium]
MHIQDRWGLCLQLIRNNVTPQQFSTWFAPISFSQFDEALGELTLCVPSPFIVEYVEEHFLKLLRAVLMRAYGEGVRLRWTVTIDATHHQTETVEATDRSTATGQAAKTEDGNKSPQLLQALDSQLNPRYTFDNFVEGAQNKLPRTVGLAIAQNPQQVTFNPLFVYGPSGCGKTHLVNAIGTRLKELHPGKRVLYVSAHLFQVQYTDAVRQNKVNDFIAFYQSIDVLIIDDVQEFATLQKTQLAFFHIFNHLHQNQRQLILTSDRPPVALQGMEERLLTRFKWGLLAELERPGEEMRRDILRSKIRHDGLQIPEEVVAYIARTVDTSVRDLEGVLNALLAYSVVWARDIDLQLAEQVILRTVGQARKERPQLTAELILERTCEYFQIDPQEVLSSSRKASVVQARQVAMYLTQKLTTLSTTRIGMAIGRRNHATVVHSCQSVTQRMASDPAFGERVKELEQMMS